LPIARPSPPKTEVARRYDTFLRGEIDVVNNDMDDVYDYGSFRSLSVSIIVNWLGKWRNKIATYGKRSGNRQVFMTEFKPYHSMGNVERHR
jgi:hypothetical protein